MANYSRPYSYDRFFDEIVGHRPLALLGEERLDRAQMIGDDPKSAILASYERFAPTLTCHAHSPSALPPEARAVPDAGAFADLIGEYHAVGYTVRIPKVGGLSPELCELMRALEIVIGNPADAVIFWSEAGAAAPVHHDEHDIIAIQLLGRKKWFVSGDPPSLPNTWKRAGEAPPQLNSHSEFDVVPGDLIYMPRGTAHTVQSITESIHLSIGFVPVTVRDAIIAALDHLSDLERPLRAGATRRADDLANGESPEQIPEQIRTGLDRFAAACRSNSFIEDAMERRLARMVADLPKLPSAPLRTPITPNSRMQHNPLAMAQLTTTEEVVDFSQPGEHIFVHRGAEESLRFVAETPEFRVADIPGTIGDDVRVALVNRLVASGFLQPGDPAS